MHSTVNRLQREQLHSDQLMTELKAIQDNTSTKASFVLKREILEKKDMMRMLMADMKKFEDLREQKKLLAEKVFEPMLEEKGVFFNKKLMRKEKFKEMYPRLLGHSQLSQYHAKCSQSNKNEPQRSLTPSKKPINNTGAPSFMNREKQIRIGDRIRPEARDHRNANKSKTPIYTIDRTISRTPPKSPKKFPKQILNNPSFMQPLNNHGYKAEAPLRPPKYGSNRGHLSKSQILNVTDRLHGEHVAKQEMIDQLWTDHKKDLFTPKINDIRYDKRDVRKALANFDGMFTRMEAQQSQFMDSPQRVYRIPVTNKTERSVKRSLLNLK
jgi:hypothetical protein